MKSQLPLVKTISIQLSKDFVICALEPLNLHLLLLSP